MKTWLLALCLVSMVTEALPGFSQPQACKQLANFPGNDAIEWGFLKFHRNNTFQALGKLAELLCCARNYDSLTWTFNGKDYPFGWKNLHRIGVELREDKGNQTLQLRSVKYSMQGNYTCVLTKGTKTQTRWNYLYVHPAVYHAGAAIFSDPPKNVSAAVGENVTFVCEGYFGTRKLISWTALVKWKLKLLGTELPAAKFPRYDIKEYYAHNRLYKKSLLTIYNVQPEDFKRRFECLVSNSLRPPGGFARKTVQLLKKSIIVVEGTQYRNVVIAVGVLAFLMVLTTILVWNFRLEIRIFLRDRFSKSELTDDVRFGAFFVYSEGSEQDSEFVTGELLEMVEERMGYNVLISDRDFIPGNAIAEEHVRCMNASARFIAVLTPDFLNDPWCDFSLNVALEAKKNIVFLHLREVQNWDEFSNGELIQSIVSVMPVIKWPRKETTGNKDRFYKRLRLKLPPQPKSDVNRAQPDKRAQSETSEGKINGQSMYNSNVSSVNDVTFSFSLDVKKKDPPTENGSPVFGAVSSNTIK